jgi:hypothetical protein
VSVSAAIPAPIPTVIAAAIPAAMTAARDCRFGDDREAERNGQRD